MAISRKPDISPKAYHSIALNGVRLNEADLRRWIGEKTSGDPIAEWEKNLFGFMDEWISEKTFIITMTSGSTGKPKQIKIPKEKMVASARMTGKFFRLKPGDTALLCLPIDYIAGKMMVVRAFVLGLNLITVSPSANPLTTDKHFDFAAMTPYQVAKILEKPTGKNKLNHISQLIIGGAEIHPAVLHEIETLTNNTWHTYGMTETLTHVAVRRINSPGKSETFTALPGVRFSADQRGCLIIDAPHISEKSVPTHDVAELIRENEFRFIGRYDNVINSGGIKLFPEMIEMKLSPFIKARFIILGIPDKKLGQKVAIILEEPEPEDFNISELATQAGLSKFETPRAVIFLKKFPLTPNGKIKRAELMGIIPGDHPEL